MMVLNRGKKAKQIILTGILLLFTVSIILAVPPTITKKTTTTTNPLNPTTQTTTMVEGRNSNGDEGATEWNQTFGRTGEDEGYCVEQTSDGGYIITGSITDSFGAGGFNVWLIKTYPNGTEEWNQTYGGTDYDMGYSVEQTSDGGYIITGFTDSFGAGGFNVWLIKTYPNGTEEWNQTYGGTDLDEGLCVEQTIPDGGYIITGSTNSFSVGGGDDDVWLIKTYPNGTEEWNQTYGRTDDEKGKGVEQTSDGGYIITGWTRSFGDGDEVWLIKTYPNGTEEWNQTYGRTGNEWGYCVEQTTPDGGYIISGWTNSFGDGSEVWLIKTNANGDTIWNQTYGGTGSEDGRCVEQTADGGYIITGGTTSFGDPDVWLLKTDANGNEVWNQTYGRADQDWAWCVEQTSDGGYIITGYTESYGAGDIDVWLIKVFHDVPFIDQPADIVYEEGSIGHNITWHPRDPVNPHMFNVTRNETLVNSSAWDGGDITVNVDGLSIGTYIFNCTVNDKLGFSASDTVMVTVTEAPEEEEEEGFPWLWLGVGVVVVAAGIGAAILYFKKE